MTVRRKRLARQRRGKKSTRVLAILAVLLVVVLSISLIGAAAAVATVRDWLKDVPDPETPGAFDVAQATRIYSADGKLLARLYLENRTVVSMKKIAPDLADATVAIEDERFYDHNGVDPVGLVRAVVRNLQNGFGSEGASTITQQYIRNTILLDEQFDISLARKVREAYLAMELEKRYDKKEILGMYLNAVYYGEGAYGAEAAARTFFSKHAKDLTLAQAALLAGLPQQPSRLSPFDNPDGALARRNIVLAAMLKNGYITDAEYREAVDEPLKVKRGEDPEGGIYRAHYFVAHVKKLLQSEFSAGVVFKGGLKVYTTLDTRLQKYAEKAVKDGVPSGPEAALVSIEPRTGHVKALVGGRNYLKKKYNLATQGKRQAGSAFKTFTLVTALQEGMPPYYRIDSSSPAVIPTKPEPWIVSNSEGSGRGAMTLESATRASVNTVFARLAYGLGPKKVVRTAKKMGITTPLSPYASIALGAQNVTPLEMASAYGTLATNGKHYEPMFITKVVDRNGDTLMEAEPEGRQAIKPSIAYATTKILKGVITGGTARRAYIGRPAAGKTGTSQNNRDVWFVGYTPQLVTSVWVGYRREKPIYVNGMRAFGGTVCAPIWADFMRKALAGEPVKDFKSQPSPSYKTTRFKNIPTGVEETKTAEPEPEPRPDSKPTKPVKPDPGDDDGGGETTSTP